jgi:hypothetical protein
MGVAEGANWTGDHGTFVGAPGYGGGQGSGSYDFAFGDGDIASGVSYAGELGSGNNGASNTLQFNGWNFLTDNGASRFLTTDLSGATPSVASGHLGLGDTTATTATAGSITLPTQAAGYLVVNIGGTVEKIPYYSN